MQLPAIQAPNLAIPANAVGPLLAVLEGDVSRLAVGQTLQAVAKSIAPNLVRLDVPQLGPLTVATQADVPDGQALAVRVRSTQPQVVLEALPRPQAASPLPTPLQPGQQLNVQVLGDAGPQRLLVAIDGKPVEAFTTSPHPPAPGTTVRVEVVDAGPVLVLKPLPAPPAVSVAVSSALLRDRLPVPPMADVIQPLLREPIAGKPALQELVTRLRELLPEQSPPAAPQLAEFVRDGGLQYESKLAKVVQSGGKEEATQVAQRDVKGLALHALAESVAEGHSATTRTVALADHVRAIEVQQTANLLAAAQGEPLVLQVPLALPGQPPTTAHLAFRGGGGGGSDADGSNVLLHVDLPETGAVRVDAFLPSGTNGMRVTFYAEKPAGKAQLLGELASLRGALEGLGKGPVSLVVRDWKQQPADQRETFQALVQGLPRGGSSLDVRV